jgi:hypothetical protein
VGPCYAIAPKPLIDRAAPLPGQQSRAGEMGGCRGPLDTTSEDRGRNAHRASAPEDDHLTGRARVQSDRRRVPCPWCARRPDVSVDAETRPPLHWHRRGRDRFLTTFEDVDAPRAVRAGAPRLAGVRSRFSNWRVQDYRSDPTIGCVSKAIREFRDLTPYPIRPVRWRDPEVDPGQA